jgi:hypothetical protein
MYKDSRGASSAVSWNLGAYTPLVFFYIENVDVRDGRFVRIATRKSAENPKLVVVSHGLEVVHFNGRRDMFCPCIRFQVERFDRLHTSSTDQNEFISYRRQPIFVPVGAIVF